MPREREEAPQVLGNVPGARAVLSPVILKSHCGRTQSPREQLGKPGAHLLQDHRFVFFDI